MKVNLNFLLSQKIKANKKGNPVCDEKNKSLPEVMLRNILYGSNEEWSGGMAVWVRMIKTDLIKINKAILLTTNGIFLGSPIKTRITKNKNKVKPSKNTRLTFKVGKLSNSKSETLLLALSATYILAR